MFFRFYILGMLGSFFFLITSPSAVCSIIFLWFFLIIIRANFSYKKLKKKQAEFYDDKSISFYMKSMRRQKQNFKIIQFLFRMSALQRTFKKLSILLDDINVKSINQDIDNFPQPSTSSDEILYSITYNYLPNNIHFRSDN